MRKYCRRRRILKTAGKELMKKNFEKVKLCMESSIDQIEEIETDESWRRLNN